jgi:hypothetical protein
VAAYIFQEDLWYIIPAELVVGQGSIALYPKLKGAKYGPYKEAWHLLRRERPKARPIEIQACAEEVSEPISLRERIWRRLCGAR